MQADIACPCPDCTCGQHTRKNTWQMHLQRHWTRAELCPGATQDAWRDKVRSPVVEDAWEVLCGSLLQEVRPAAAHWLEVAACCKGSTWHAASWLSVHTSTHLRASSCCAAVRVRHLVGPAEPRPRVSLPHTGRAEPRLWGAGSACQAHRPAGRAAAVRPMLLSPNLEALLGAGCV